MPPEFDPGAFDCGEADLTDYLCGGDARRDQRTGFSRTYLIFSGDQLVGYFTVLADAIRLRTKERPDDIHYPAAPALKLGRMGVHHEYRGRHGVGPWILDYVVGLARRLSKEVGIRYVTLDALPHDALVRWYGQYGFVRNHGEEDLQKVLRELFRKISREKDLSTVSMRFDILLREELAPG